MPLTCARGDACERGQLIRAVCPFTVSSEYLEGELMQQLRDLLQLFFSRDLAIQLAATTSEPQLVSHNQ